MNDPTPESVLRDFRSLMVRLTHCPDAGKRAIVCTPCGGNYGEVAAWVVAVNGSPPRGIIFIGQNRYGVGADDVFFIDTNKCRRLSKGQAKIARLFESGFLPGPHATLAKVGVVTIPDTGD